MKTSGATAALLTLFAVTLGTADRAGAATTDIGAVTEIREATPPSPTAAGGNVVQVGEATGSYAVPPGYGTISSWRHSAGASAGTLTFKVYRPTGAVREFQVVASDTRAVSPRTVQSFPVQIPVRPGDRIGLSSEDLQLAYETFNPADLLGFFEPDPPQGTVKATDGLPFEEFKLNVAATLQSDPDAPGGRAPGATPGATPSPEAPLGKAPAAGTAFGPPPGSLLFATSSRPAASQLRVLPSAFAAARSGPSVTRRRTRGARVSYRVTARAAMRFKVRQARSGRRQKASGKTARCVAPTRGNRKAAKCIRTVTLAGSFTQMAKKGTNSLRFTGRLRGRGLKRGAYELVATPRVGSKTGRSATSRFRITR